MRKRRLLTTLTAVVSLAVMLAVPGSSPSRAATSPIQHIVVLNLENHSFQNVLGFWCQANPRCGPGDAMPSSVTLSDGSVVTPSVSPDVVPGVDHSMESQLAAIDGGRMDGWQNTRRGQCAAATGYQCITGYRASQVPDITSLAGSYALNDRFFSMKDSPSWGGHMYAVAATTDGFTGDNPQGWTGTGPGWGCDSGKLATRTTGFKQPSCVPDFTLGLPNGGASAPTKAAYVPTIMDRLDAAGLPWNIYGPASPADSGYIWNTCATFAECLYTGQKSHVAEPPQFFTAAAAGTLPSFSLIMAGGAGNAAVRSCHNGYSMTKCDNYIGQVAGAVQASPDWSSTALIITFDDYGGFYDSQPPAVNPDGTLQGPRLPLIVVSPFAVPASTDSTPATFASILAFTEHTFGLAPLSQNDATAYPLTGMFTPGLVAHPAHRVRMVTRPVPKGDHILWALAKEGS